MPLNLTMNKRTKAAYVVLSNIRPEQIQELIVMGPKPLPIVLNILNAVMVILNKPETWEEIMTHLKDFQFVGKLMEITP